jgi:hypothetical protein
MAARWVVALHRNLWGDSQDDNSNLATQLSVPATDTVCDCTDDCGSECRILGKDWYDWLFMVLQTLHDLLIFAVGFEYLECWSGFHFEW